MEYFSWNKVTSGVPAGATTLASGVCQFEHQRCQIHHALRPWHGQKFL